MPKIAARRPDRPPRPTEYAAQPHTRLPADRYRAHLTILRPIRRRSTSPKPRWYR